MVKGRREGEEFPTSDRHLLPQTDFPVDMLRSFGGSLCQVGKSDSCLQAEERDPLPPPKALWGSGLVLIMHKA